MTSIPRLTEKHWKSHEAVICDLFRRDGLPLREVKSFMEKNHKFTPSDRQWKHRIKRWKLDRNIKNEEMKAIVMKRQYRLLAEPHQPELRFRVRGFEVDPKKIIRWMHEHEIAHDQFYNGYLGTQLPSDISCYTDPQQSSLSANGDVVMNATDPVLPLNTLVLPMTAPLPLSIPPSLTTPLLHTPLPVTLSPGSASRHGSDTSTPDPTFQEVSEPVASEASEPKCRVETIDMSWAFDTPWQELLDGHQNDQQGYPLGALVQFLNQEALAQGSTLSARTFAELLQVSQTEAEAYRRNTVSFTKDGVAQGIEWNVTIERKLLRSSIQFVWAHVESESNTKELRTWLELRLRIASDNRYYREGSVTLQVVHEPGHSDELLTAIEDDDVVEVQRILSSGEATVFSVVEDDHFPISFAVYARNVELTRLLLEHGSPLCAYYGSPENFIRVIWARFSCEWSYARERSFEDGFARCKELTTLALEYGARIDECVQHKSSYGNLMFCIMDAEGLESHEAQQVLGYLLHLGVEMEFRNNHGHTPLLHAIDHWRPSPAIISAYMALGADISARDNKGWGYMQIIIDTVLHPPLFGRQQQHKELLVVLLRADPKFRDRPITPNETPMLRELALNKEGWNLWTSVFNKMGWDMGEMDVFYAQVHTDSEPAETPSPEYV